MYVGLSNPSALLFAAVAQTSFEEVKTCFELYAGIDPPVSKHHRLNTVFVYTTNQSKMCPF